VVPHYLTFRGGSPEEEDSNTMASRALHLGLRMVSAERLTMLATKEKTMQNKAAHPTADNDPV
jgi:hypothetical protein